MSLPEPLTAAEGFERLYRAYGPQHWWPGDTPLEVIVGAILTQNTAWTNVAIAVRNLLDAGLLSLEALLAAPADAVREAIRPSGFYNVKYTRLRAVLEYVAAQGGVETLAARPAGELRHELLGAHGVGRETADTILLYALEKPAFVIDKYTRRLFARLGHAWAETADYDALQRWFVAGLPASVPLYFDYHALIVEHSKRHCRATPRCAGCPLSDRCLWFAERVAVTEDPATSAAGSRIGECIAENRGEV